MNTCCIQVNDISVKILAGINDTGDKFFVVVKDSGEESITL